MNTARTQAGSGGNLPNRQPQFMRGFDRPDSFVLGIGNTSVCSLEPLNHPLLVSDAVPDRFRRLHTRMLLRAVQKTGQLKPVGCSVTPQHLIYAIVSGENLASIRERCGQYLVGTLRRAAR